MVGNIKIVRIRYDRSSPSLFFWFATVCNDTSSTYTGQCFYNCEQFNATIKNDVRYVYHYLPRDSKNLINDSACTHFHRRDLLYGDCEEGHAQSTGTLTQSQLSSL